MTVAELIENLKEFKPDLEVWLSKDSEGNDFKPISVLGLGEVDEVENYVLVLWPGWYVED